MIPEKQEPNVTLEVRTAALEFWVENAGTGPLRVWDCSNSWGWGTHLLVIQPGSEPSERFLLEPQPRMWTRNGPGFIEIPPGAGHLVVLRPGDPEWSGFQDIDHLREDVILVQGLLRIPPSPEASRFNVFVGRAISSTHVSAPPHRWLFAHP
jgi:hypothetical protein